MIDALRRFYDNNQRTVTSRKADRERIAADAERFLAAGGTIKREGATAPKGPDFLGPGMNVTKAARSRGGKA